MCVIVQVSKCMNGLLKVHGSVGGPSDEHLGKGLKGASCGMDV